MSRRAFLAVVRSMEARELEYLRALVVEQHQELEELRQRAESAEQAAESWRDMVLMIEEESEAPTGTPIQIGMTKEGELVLLKDNAKQVQ